MAITCVGAVVAAPAVSSVMAADASFYVSLHYEVDGSAHGCWDERDFRRSVTHAVGYDPFRSDAPVSVRVQVGGSPELVDGRVDWRNAAGAGMGERRFLAKDGDCSKLLTEMSFAVGLQIQLLRPQSTAATAATSTADGPDSSTHGPARDAASPPRAAPAATPATARSAAPPSPPSATAPSASARAPDVTTDAASASGSPEPWRFWVGIGTSVAWGLAPSLTGQGQLFVGARRDHLSLELGAEATLPVTAHQSDGSAFRQNLIGGSLSLCGHHGALAACALAKASQLRVSGLVDEPRSPSAFVAQAGLRLAATWEISGPWSMTPHIDTLGLLTPRTVALNDVGVWSMPRLALLAGIDVAARFR
jgi:hypothetical protein